MEGGFERINHRQEPLSLREEFRCRRFGLQHDWPIDFLRSQVRTYYFTIFLVTVI